MDVMKPWIAKRITEMLGFEDDIVVEPGAPRLDLVRSGHSGLQTRRPFVERFGVLLLFQGSTVFLFESSFWWRLGFLPFSRVPHFLALLFG